MKYYYLIIVFLFSSCSENNQDEHNAPPSVVDEKPEKISKSEFQEIIDSALVDEAVLVYDPQQEVYYSNDFAWIEKGKLPASTSASGSI